MPDFRVWKKSGVSLTTVLCEVRGQVVQGCLPGHPHSQEARCADAQHTQLVWPAVQKSLLLSSRHQVTLL